MADVALASVYDTLVAMFTTGIGDQFVISRCCIGFILHTKQCSFYYNRCISTTAPFLQSLHFYYRLTPLRIDLDFCSDLQPRSVPLESLLLLTRYMVEIVGRLHFLGFPCRCSYAGAE